MMCHLCGATMTRPDGRWVCPGGTRRAGHREYVVHARDPLTDDIVRHGRYPVVLNRTMCGRAVAPSRAAEDGHEVTCVACRRAMADR